MGASRVVLAVDAGRQRALLRIGLEMTGRFDVVGVVVDESDVEAIVRSLRPDIVVIDFEGADDRGRHLLPVVTDAAPSARPVLLADLAPTEGEHPRPAQVARQLAELLDASHPLRVLLVDDDPGVLEMFELLLSLDERFCVVGNARDGVEALEQAQATSPDAIVLDLMMPRMDGLEALPRLRETCPDARVVVVSARPAADEAIERGAAAFLLKTEAASELPAVLAATQ